MIVINGITGRVGGKVASDLLARGVAVRGVVRDKLKADIWAESGCELAAAQPTDKVALTNAFRGAEAVFILPPPVFDPQPGFGEAYQAMVAQRDAVLEAGVSRVVYLSTIGAQARQTNLLSQHTIGESLFRELPIPVTFLRPAWFMENAAWDIPGARDSGVLHSFLQPVDRVIPMVATKDVGRVAAELIQETWVGQRVVELEGPVRISPNDLAETLSLALGRGVETEAVPRSNWEKLFTEQGMGNPYPRIRMLDGFNEGWIEFESAGDTVRKGAVELTTVIRDLIAG